MIRLEAPAGTHLFGQGDPFAGLPIIVQGRIQIWITHESGREIIWYELTPGETCLASLGALFDLRTHNASA